MNIGQEAIPNWGLKRCSECKKLLPFDHFWVVNDPEKSKDGHYSKCKKCGKKENHDKYDESFLENLVYGCRRRAAKKKEPCDVTDELVMRKLEIQNWRCAYSGIQMTMDHHDFLYAVSVDRINSDLPYIESNVILCCQAVNYIKGKDSIDELRAESHAVAMNALPLDNPYLLKRENEGISAITSEKAAKKPMDFLEGVTFERYGRKGASVGYTPKT